MKMPSKIRRKLKGGSRCNEVSSISFPSFAAANAYRKVQHLKSRKIVKRGENDYRIVYTWNKSEWITNDSLREEYKFSRRQYIKIADELGYPESIKEKIQNAESLTEVNYILALARHGGK